MFLKLASQLFVHQQNIVHMRRTDFFFLKRICFVIQNSFLQYYREAKNLDWYYLLWETKGTIHLRSWSGEKFLFLGTAAGASHSPWWHKDKRIIFSLFHASNLCVARMSNGYTAPDARWEAGGQAEQYEVLTEAPERMDSLHHTLMQSCIFKEQSSPSLAEMPPRHRNKIGQKVWSKSLAWSDKPYYILFQLWRLEDNTLSIYSFLHGSSIN